MRKNLIFTAVLIGNFLFSQVGINTDKPDSSAALDIQSVDETGNNKKGILIPRVKLSSTTDKTNNPARGLLIYNTITQNDVLEDNFYYFDGTKWNPLLSNNNNKAVIVPELAAALRLEHNITLKEIKTPITFDKNILSQKNNLIDYDFSDGTFTIQQDGTYCITLQVGLTQIVEKQDIVIGIIAAKELDQISGKHYNKNDWMGRSTFSAVYDDNKSDRTFSTYTTYISFKKGDKFQAAVKVDEIRTAGAKTAIQGIQTGSSGDGNITNISIVKY